MKIAYSHLVSRIESKPTIEELSDIIINVTGADPSLASYKESEILTTTTKVVDISKSIEDLNHENTVGLEDGIKITADWMRVTYGL